MPEVLKVGGSLFARTDFPPLLHSWLSNRPPARRAFVVGGGESADLVRNWADRFQLSDHSSHWLAVQAMELQASLAATLLGLPQCRSFAECDQRFATGEREVLFLPLAELIAESAGGAESLPASWDVTSDSIAAWAAKRMHAERLFLLKSVGDERAIDLVDAVALGWVDPWFPRVVATPTTWVDLASGREWECSI